MTQVTLTLTTSQLAALAGVRADTVRYYERVGLLPAPARNPAGYRTYDEAAVGRLRFPNQGRPTGGSAIAGDPRAPAGRRPGSVPVWAHRDAAAPTAGRGRRRA